VDEPGDEERNVRVLKSLVQSSGFEIGRFENYVYDGANPPDYMLTIVDRGADALQKSGRIGGELAAALRTEARRRVKTGEFFGQITYASLIARKPSSRDGRANTVGPTP